ncbi:hypothetical protein [Marinoscillum furvescens]|uniref:Uncharacterized protein n=1 Tax=Marinoscillum furvescens DSM 4134 TaxID=1122208 RepID=A0A3D9LGK2_MARFU|nr:hypothetical protein [Marinoscillum furvescens]REE05778.1 hypothetical protein C7460_101297 [Marinoscillum furvescens DSM 4134]
MVTVHINEKSKQAKALIEMLKTFSFVEIEEKPRYNEETEQAIKEAKAGKNLIQTKSHEDLMEKLRS